jgi:dTDP-4-dehydrorhamnose 3,5-epimerase
VHVVPTAIAGVLIVEPHVHRDGRGYFLESYHAARYSSAGIHGSFVQDNHSRSVGGTLRGLHLQFRRPQAKLVRVIEGEIYDVVVDTRRGSPTFGRWVGITLNAGDFRQCYIPEGLAHGFCVTSAVAQVEYKTTDFYDPEGELGIAWNDPDLAIPWPVDVPILSERDGRNPFLRELSSKLPAYRPPEPERT